MPHRCHLIPGVKPDSPQKCEWSVKSNPMTQKCKSAGVKRCAAPLSHPSSEWQWRQKIYQITPWVSSETLPTVVPGLRLSIGAPLLFNHTWRFWVSRISHAECSTCAHKAFFFFFFFNVTWNVIICGKKLFWFRSDKACLTGYLGMRVQRWHGPWIILGRGGGPQREVVPRSGSRVWVCARARCRLRQRWNDQHVILRPWRSHKSQQRMSRAHAHKKKEVLEHPHSPRR